MFQPPILTAPMGFEALMTASEALAKQAGALSKIAEGVEAYEAATGQKIAVFEQGRQVYSGWDVSHWPNDTILHDGRGGIMPVVAGDPPGSIGSAQTITTKEPGPDPEMLKKLMGDPDRTVVVAARQFGKFEMHTNRLKGKLEPEPSADNPPPVSIADEDEDDSHMPEALRAEPTIAVNDPLLKYLTGLDREEGWSVDDDIELLRRAIDGEAVGVIATTMETSLRSVKARFNALMGRDAGGKKVKGPEVSRERVLHALQHLKQEGALR